MSRSSNATRCRLGGVQLKKYSAYDAEYSKVLIIFADLSAAKVIGEMLEWLKRHAWKACGLPKGLASSNLALSAETALQTKCRAVFQY